MDASEAKPVALPALENGSLALASEVPSGPHVGREKVEPVCDGPTVLAASAVSETVNDASNYRSAVTEAPGATAAAQPAIPVGTLLAAPTPQAADIGVDEDSAAERRRPPTGQEEATTAEAMGSEAVRAPVSIQPAAGHPPASETQRPVAPTQHTPPTENGDALDPSLSQRRHHLLRHTLPASESGPNALHHFGATALEDAVAKIQAMSQRDLQAMFERVYGIRSSSNNNNWLRKKLLEGADHSCRPPNFSWSPSSFFSCAAYQIASFCYPFLFEHINADLLDPSEHPEVLLLPNTIYDPFCVPLFPLAAVSPNGWQSEFKKMNTAMDRSSGRKRPRQPARDDDGPSPRATSGPALHSKPRTTLPSYDARKERALVLERAGSAEGSGGRPKRHGAAARVAAATAALIHDPDLEALEQEDIRQQSLHGPRGLPHRRPPYDMDMHERAHWEEDYYGDVPRQPRYDPYAGHAAYDHHRQEPPHPASRRGHPPQDIGMTLSTLADLLSVAVTSLQSQQQQGGPASGPWGGQPGHAPHLAPPPSRHPSYPPQGFQQQQHRTAHGDWGGAFGGSPALHGPAQGFSAVGPARPPPQLAPPAGPSAEQLLARLLQFAQGNREQPPTQQAPQVQQVQQAQRHQQQRQQQQQQYAARPPPSGPLAMQMPHLGAASRGPVSPVAANTSGGMPPSEDRSDVQRAIMQQVQALLDERLESGGAGGVWHGRGKEAASAGGGAGAGASGGNTNGHGNGNGNGSVAGPIDLGKLPGSTFPVDPLMRNLLGGQGKAQDGAAGVHQ